MNNFSRALRPLLWTGTSTGALLVLLGLLAVSSWPRPAHATNGQCIWEGGLGALVYPECINEDCLLMGGRAQCTNPVIRPESGFPDDRVDGQDFNYHFGSGEQLDDGIFCRGEGGTFNGLGGNPECSNLPDSYNGLGDAVTEDAAYSAAQAAMDHKLGGDPNCSVVMQSDSGWGVSGGLIPPPNYINGQVTGSFKIRIYAACSSTYSVTFQKVRSMLCPMGWGQRRLPNGYLQCVIPAASCTNSQCGNPFSLVTGGKLAREADYSGPGPAGLELAHYYNSGGPLPPSGPGASMSSPNDFWKISYQRHLNAVSGNTYLMAFLAQEDGTLEYFDGSGSEILNRSGAADRLAVNGSSGWTLTRADRAIETYDINGNLTSITTASGLVTTVSYANGLISQVTDNFGHKLTYAYDPSGQVSQVTLPDGISTVTYGYSDLGILKSVTYPDNTSKQYLYEDPNSSWLLTGIIDENAVRFATYTYNPLGQVIHEEHAGGVESYNVGVGSTQSMGQNVASVTDPLGQNRQYYFSNSAGVYKLNQVNSYCSTCPNRSQTVYDANGNPQSSKDLNLNSTLYTYDATRNLETSRTEGNSGYAGGGPTSATRTVTTQWHPTFRLPIQISLYSGPNATGTPLRTTSNTYDSYSNRLTRSVTDGATGTSRNWTYTYYNSGLYGQLQTSKGPRTDVNDLTTYTYYNCTTGAQCGQLQSVTDALGHVTTYNSYDANGMPLTITDANGVTTTLTYDLRQHLKTSTTAGEQTRLDYYPTGFPQRVTLPDGSYITYIYDAAHRLTEIDDSIGDRLVYTLDGAGNHLREQAYDPSGTLQRVRARLYNSLGQLWQELTSAATDSQATVYTYDSEGNQTNIRAPLFRSSAESYDTLNRLVQLTDPNSGVTSFGYDATDNLTSATDPRQLVTSYVYNGFGDLKQVTSPDTGVTQNGFDSAGNIHTSTDSRGLQATYSYDALNRNTQIVYPDQTVGFTYDQVPNGVGRLSTVTDSSGHTDFSYDTHGRITQKRHTIGSVALTVGYEYQNSRLASVTTPSGQTLTYAYNANGQMSGISVNGTTIISGIQYNPFGPIAGWTWGNGTSATRSYDIDGHLFQVQSAGTSTYTFYDDGAINSRSDDTESDYSVVAGTMTVGISATSNQLTGTTGTLVRTYAYDNRGNTTGTGSAAFTYDGANRMSSASVAGQTTTYVLNALGQRVRKSSSAGSTLFAYDEAGHLLGEYSGTGALIQETVWLQDTPIATLRPAAAGGIDIYYVHSDHLNTPRRVTRASDNTLVWRWASDPYGVGFVDQDPSGTGTLFTYNLRFPGQYYDVETGLAYNAWRDYDPTTGRYVESDPIGLAGGSYSTYAYADGDPLSEIDPLGLAPPGRTGQPSLLPPGPFDYPSPGLVQKAAAQASQGVSDAVNTLLKICKPDCWRIEAQITAVALELRWRYVAALRDRRNLYDRAREAPISGRSGSWKGHKQQFEEKQDTLRDLIKEADANNCLVTDEDRRLAEVPYPDMPAGRFSR